MIYIITTHYKTDVWFKPQKEHLEKYTVGDYMVLCGCYKVDIPDDEKYARLNISHMPDIHFTQVNLLADANLLPKLEDDDIFIFLDCDCFPCDFAWDKKIKTYLEDHDVVSVYRDEERGIDNHYDDIPHLCFFATRKKTWIENNLKWALDGFENPQVGMKRRLNKANLKIKKLKRTNVFNAHRVCFGIYDDLLYHHCCAIRGFDGEVWEGADFFLRGGRNGLFYAPGNEATREGDLAKVNAGIWNLIWEGIKNDETNTFVRRYFMGKS